ncbi:MAG: hypothetical protein RIS70_2609 [Planctomycetota bacterium]
MTPPLIEITCEGCKTRMLVPGEHTGRVACPSCGLEREIKATTTSSMITTPLAATAVADATTGPLATYHLRTPEGQDYGPVDEATLEQWICEGRVSHDCSVFDGRIWSSAGDLYPELAPAPVTSPVRTPQPPTPRTTPTANEHRFVLPHRGTMVFTLAMLGMITWIPVLSIMAWLLGSSDLAQIDAGRRDPSGRMLTAWGRTVGAVASIAWVLAILVGMVILIYWSQNFA